MKRVVVGIAIVVAVALVVAFAPVVRAEYRYTETYYESEPYEVTETYYEDEPYEVTETYTEDVQLELEILEHHLEEGFLWHIRGKVENTTNQTLHWMDVIIGAQYEIEELPGRTFTQPGGLDPIPSTFKPGEIRDFSVLVQEGTTSYEITRAIAMQTVESERTVTKYRQVEKERTVTKYRQVEKERLVIQYKRVPIFEYLRSRF